MNEIRETFSGLNFHLGKATTSYFTSRPAMTEWTSARVWRYSGHVPSASLETLLFE